MQANSKQSYTTSLLLVGCLFFIFGFVTWLNGTLIFFLKKVCELNNFQAYFVTFAFFISYFVMALPSSALLKKTGFKKGMSLGLFTMAIGTLIFIPAAHQRSYPLFLTGLFVIGLGLSILQTASNPYVTILGPEASAAKRISIMGVCNKAAGFLSPIVLGTVLLRNIDLISKQLDTVTDAATRTALLNELSQRIVTPYIVFTIILFILAILINLSPLPELQEEKENPEVLSAAQHPTLLRHTYLVLGALAIFVYVGVEVLAGDSIINYGKYLGIPIDTAKYFTSLTLAFMVFGYFVGIALMPRIISQEKALKLYTILALLLATGVLCTTGTASIGCLAALGFAHSIMWPAIWPMSLKGLGKFTKTGAALLIMGIAGGAIIPLIYGRVADAANPRAAYMVMIPCYLFILYFATYGHKVGYKEKSVAAI
ncbi:MAG: sugar MFS transporter [Taibaiella sp.]|nr:sugar MFS transporter [Taibaiella sp.]